jgi:hypothetical protein
MAALLSRAEEVELAKRIERGDLDAKDELIARNRGLAYKVATLHAVNGECEDLAQEGVLGLIRAAERFDWRRGVRFGTFAWPHVEWAVKRAAPDLAPTNARPLDAPIGESGFLLHEAIEDEVVDDDAMDPADALAARRRELRDAELALERHREDRKQARVCPCCEESLAGEDARRLYVDEVHRNRFERTKRKILDPLREEIAQLKVVIRDENQKQSSSEPLSYQAVERDFNRDSDGSSLNRKPRPKRNRPGRGEGGTT